MIIGITTIELNLPEANSLKDKRSILKSLLARLHREFNVTAAEVALHDSWRSASIGVGVISTNAGHAQNVIDTVMHWIERNRPDIEIVDNYVELIPFSSASGN